MDWDVPFKPHAAIKYKVHKKGACLPVEGTGGVGLVGGVGGEGGEGGVGVG